MQKRFFYLSETEVQKINVFLSGDEGKSLDFVDNLFMGQNLLCKIETIQILFSNFLEKREFFKINLLLRKVLNLFNESFEDNALIINIILQLFKNISAVKIDTIDYDIIYQLEKKLSQHNDLISLGYFYKLLGELHFENEDYKLAVYYFEEALAYLTGNKWINLEEIHYKVAICSIITEKFSEAYSHFYTALYEYKQKNNSNKILEIYFWLSYLFISIHESKSADEFLSSDIMIDDNSLYSVFLLLKSYYYLLARDFETFHSIYSEKLLEENNDVNKSLNLLKSLLNRKIINFTEKV